MMRFTHVKILLFFSILVVSGAARSEVDGIVHEIVSSGKSPFVQERAAKAHASYPSIEALAQKLGSRIQWTSSVSKSVLRLPFHPDRFRFDRKEEFDGWFDEFTSPNLILVHRKATLAIVVHELRHALHLGGHGFHLGNRYDRTLQRSKTEIQRFHQDLQRSGLRPSRISRLKQRSTRLLESFSEVMAHHGDLQLAQAFRHESEMTQRDFIRGYKSEFLRALRVLKTDPFASRQRFVSELEIAFQDYLREI